LELRIVDVGNGILQFKFSSQYQMEWVEKSGHWNFDNNLLLLCRWKKGANIGQYYLPTLLLLDSALGVTV